MGTYNLCACDWLESNWSGSIGARLRPQKFETCPVWGAINLSYRASEFSTSSNRPSASKELGGTQNIGRKQLASVRALLVSCRKRSNCVQCGEPICKLLILLTALLAKAVKSFGIRFEAYLGSLRPDDPRGPGPTSVSRVIGQQSGNNLSPGLINGCRLLWTIASLGVRQSIAPSTLLCDHWRQSTESVLQKAAIVLGSPPIAAETRLVDAKETS